MKVSNGLKTCPALSKPLLPRRVHPFILSVSSCLPFPGLRCQAFHVMCLEMLPISLVSRDASSLSDLKTTLDEVGEFKSRRSSIFHVVLVLTCKRERTTVRATVPCQSPISFCRTVRFDTLQTKPRISGAWLSLCQYLNLNFVTSSLYRLCFRNWLD